MLLCYNRRPTATPNVSLFRFIFFCPSFQCFATGFAPLFQFCKHHIFFNTVVDDFDNFSVDVRFDFSHSFNLGQDSFARIGTSTTSHAYFKFGARHGAKILVWVRRVRFGFSSVRFGLEILLDREDMRTSGHGPPTVQICHYRVQYLPPLPTPPNHKC